MSERFPAWSRTSSIAWSAARDIALEREVMDCRVWRSSSLQARLVAHAPGGLAVPTAITTELDLLGLAGAIREPVLEFELPAARRVEFALRAGPDGACRARVRLEQPPVSIALRVGLVGAFACSELRLSPVSRGRGSPRIAAIVHAFHEPLWPELAECVGRIAPERLYVSIAEHAPAHLESAIRRDFPGAYVRRVPNRGRDVLPFLEWLEVAEAHGVDLLCKLHGKRSGHLPAGGEWRRDLLDKLAGSPDTVHANVARFVADPGLGILGPGGHVVASSFFWERNAQRVHQLASRMGFDARQEAFRFAAGSMFWARPAAFRAVRALALSEQDFEAESGQLDGTTAHALERCFGISALALGMTVAETGNPAGTRVQDFAP